MRKIRLHEREDGSWHFQPIASNGEAQATSEPYPNVDNARRGARDLFPDDALVFEYVRTSGGS